MAERQRAENVRALRAALYLAARLGCHCVEAVGGARVPQTHPPGEATCNPDPERYVEYRRDALVKSLDEVFLQGGDRNWLGDPDQPDDPDDPNPRPLLALELEPSASYLLRDVATFYEVWNRLDAKVRERVGLNADLAHFFLIGVKEPGDLIQDHRTGKPWKWDKPDENGRTFADKPRAERLVEATPEDLERLKDLIFHMHVSDHGGDAHNGGVHASDLVPGNYHLIEHYRPWLEFACAPPPRFSRTVAIELEANFRPEDLLTARNVVRRWLAQVVRGGSVGPSVAAPPRPVTPAVGGQRPARDADFHEVAILVMDLGNSTEEFYRAAWHPTPSEDSMAEKEKARQQRAARRESALALHYVLDQVCAAIRRSGGSVMSFAGDGVFALYENRLLPGAAAHAAQTTAWELSRVVKGALDECRARFDSFDREVFLTLRCALHWGECYIPTTGTLTDKAVSPDMVCAARLCNWLSGTVEPAEARHGRGRGYDRLDARGSRLPDGGTLRPRDGRDSRPLRRVLTACTDDFHERLLAEQKEGRVPVAFQPFEPNPWEAWGFEAMKGLGDTFLWVGRR
jgi:hypothetical protein